MEMITFMKQRIIYLDILKVIAIFLICFMHYVLLNPTWFDNFVDMFCFAGVSLFFLVNGALLFNKPFDLKKHYKKIINMILVLLAWEIISAIYFTIMYRKDYMNYNVQDIISYLIGGVRWELPTGHFWFIIALISIYILFPLLKIVYDNPISGKQILLWHRGY